MFNDEKKFVSDLYPMTVTCKNNN